MGRSHVQVSGTRPAKESESNHAHTSGRKPAKASGLSPTKASGSRLVKARPVKKLGIRSPSRSVGSPGLQLG